MADIQLLRPEAGSNQNIACAPDANFVFGFPTDAATLSRSGDNLVMTFDDGATLSLTDFYKSYTSKNMPSFEVDGAQVAGEDFFTAMNEPDLMPAAGPSGSTPGGGRFHQYENMALYDGLDRLGGLDVGWPDGGYEPVIEGGAGLLPTGEESGNGIPSIEESGNGIPTITPSNPNNHGMDPNTPVFPNPNDPDNPPYPGGNENPFTGRDVLVVSERGLPNGTDSNAPTTAKGSMHVESPDGVERLEVGGKTVYENGKFTPQDIVTDEGVLHVTDYNPESGELTYEYELKESSPEHDPDKGAGDRFGHDIPVTVTDPDGDSASSTITVVVEDDAPQALDDTDKASAGETIHGSVLGNDTPGADGYGDFDGSRVQWNVEGEHLSNGDIVVHTEYGDATLHPDGSYDFTANEDLGLKPGDSVPLTFDYTITDSDGDISDATLTVTVTTPGITPDVPDPDDPVPTPDPDDPKVSVPSGIPGMIYVDEGTNPESKTEGDTVDATHKPHGQSGKGSFDVQLHGEKGTITLTDVYGNRATLTVDENGHYTLEGSTTFQINGVTVTLENDDQLSKNADGSWKVDYSYKWNGPQEHTEDDTTITGENITITVKDESGDTATAKLTAEVHDDVPVLTVNDATDTVNVDMGADVDGAYDGSGEARVEVFAQNADGKAEKDPVIWKADDANKVSDLTEMRNGETWKSADGSMTVTKEGDNYTFHATEDGNEKDIYVRATDADNDTVQQQLNVSRPGITPTTPDPEPDPDHTDNNPSGTPGKIIVDEADWAKAHGLEAGTGDAQHGYKGDGSFFVQLNGESGTIKVGGEHGYIIEVDKDGKITKITDNTGENGGIIVHGVKVTLDCKTGDTLTEGENGWQVKYNYELTEPQDHKSGDILSGSIEITATDESGDTVNGKLDVEVHNDEPESEDVSHSLHQGDRVMGNVTDNDNFGADMPDNVEYNSTIKDEDGNVLGQDTEAQGPVWNGQGDYVEWHIPSEDSGELETWKTDHHVQDVTQNSDGSYTLTTEDGTNITLYEDGSYDVQVGADESLHALKFDYTLKDNDGNTTESSLNLTINGSKTTTPEPETPDTPSEPTPDTNPDILGSDNNIYVGGVSMQTVEVQTSGQNICLCIDISRSLLDPAYNAVKYAVVDAINAIFDSMPESNVTVLAFAGFYENLFDEYHIDGGDGTLTRDEWAEFCKKFNNNMDEVATQLFGTRATGAKNGTDYENVLKGAKKWFYEQHATGSDNHMSDKIVFLSDGASLNHIQTSEIGDETYDGNVKLFEYESWGNILDNEGKLTADPNGKLTGKFDGSPKELTNFYAPDGIGLGAHIFINGEEYVVDQIASRYSVDDKELWGTGEDGKYNYARGMRFHATPVNRTGIDTHDMGLWGTRGEMGTENGNLDGYYDVNDKWDKGEDNNYGKVEGNPDIFDPNANYYSQFIKEMVDKLRDSYPDLDIVGRYLDNNEECNARMADQYIGALLGLKPGEHVDMLDESQLAEALQEAIKKFTADIPSSEIVLGAEGNDILFGDTASIPDGITPAQYASEIAENPTGYDTSNSLQDYKGGKIHFDGDDVLVGGSGSDIIYGQGGNDLLIGDGSNSALPMDYANMTGEQIVNKLRSDIEDAIKTDLARENAGGAQEQTPGALDTLLAKFEGDATAGNDKLFGGDGDDILIGGAGNDYLKGGEVGKDDLFGGSGDDLIVYDKSDYAVFGGDGIDIMLSNDHNAESLEILLQNGVPEGAGDKSPMVREVEVFLKDNGQHASRDFAVEDLTSLSQLADKANIYVNGNELKFGDGWEVDGYTATNVELGLTAELSDSMIQTQVDQTVFQLNTQGG